MTFIDQVSTLASELTSRMQDAQPAVNQAHNLRAFLKFFFADLFDTGSADFAFYIWKWEKSYN